MNEKDDFTLTGVALVAFLGVGVLIGAAFGVNIGVSEITRSFLGAFFGAAFAFFVSEFRRGIDQRQANIQSGNLTQFIIAGYINECWELRAMLRHRISKCRADFGDTPDWCLLNPTLISIDDSTRFDFQQLAYLLDSLSGRALLPHIRQSERLHSNLAGTMRAQHKAAEDLQVAGVDLARGQPHATFEEIAVHVGPELVARNRDLFRAVLLRAERDHLRHSELLNNLTAELSARFGRKNVWILSIKPEERFSEPQLPALPVDLLRWLNEQ